MGVIRDRLREKYKNNSNRIDARWTLDDVVSADEISGSFLSASAYELSFPADQPDTARIECAKAFPLRNGPLVLITNLRTGQDAWQEPPIDEGKELAKGLTVAGVLALVCSFPLMLGWVVSRKENLAARDKIGFWLAASGFWVAFALIILAFYLTNFQRAWERPPDPFFGVAPHVAGLGVVAFAVGLLMVPPRTSTTLGLHAVAAVIAGLICGLAARGVNTYGNTWLGFFVGAGILTLVLASSLRRFRRARA